MKKSNAANSSLINQEKNPIAYLEEDKGKIEWKISINKELKSNNIRSSEDIDDVPWWDTSIDINLLTVNKNDDEKIEGMYYEYVHYALPQAPTKVVEIQHKNISQGNVFKLSILETIDKKDIEQLYIPELVTADLKVIRDHCYDGNDITLLHNPNKKLINEIHRLRKEQLREITDEEVRNIYYENEIRKYNKDIKKEYIKSLSEEYIQLHYQKNITALKKELKEIRNKIRVLKDSNKNFLQLSLLQSPNHIYNGVRGLEQKKQLSKAFGNHLNLGAITLAFKHTNPELYHEIESLDSIENKKKKVSTYIQENSEKIISYIIGAKLNKREDIIFSTLRALAVKAFQNGIVDSPDRKITIKTTAFYTLCNLTKATEGGYDTKEKRKIKDLLLNPESNLLKPIFYGKDNTFVVTSFIKYLCWNNESTITFEIDGMFFVNGEKGLSYFYEDLEGRNRLISKMPRSDAAYKLHKYLSYSLKSVKQDFNITTLLEESGLINSYNKGQKNRALEELQKTLECMFEEKTIIKNHPMRLSSGSDNKGKYCLVNLRYNEIQLSKKIKKNKVKQNKKKLITSNLQPNIC